MTAAIMVRKDRKQAWANAGVVPLLDSPKRVEEMTEQFNTQAGFIKFRVA